MSTDSYGERVWIPTDRTGPTAAQVAAEEQAAAERQTTDYTIRWVMGDDYRWVRRRVYHARKRALPERKHPTVGYRETEIMAAVHREVARLRAAIASAEKFIPANRHERRCRDAQIRDWHHEIDRLGAAIGLD